MSRWGDHSVPRMLLIWKGSWWQWTRQIPDEHCQSVSIEAEPRPASVCTLRAHEQTVAGNLFITVISFQAKTCFTETFSVGTSYSSLSSLPGTQPKAGCEWRVCIKKCKCKPLCTPPCFFHGMKASSDCWFESRIFAWFSLNPWTCIDGNICPESREDSGCRGSEKDGEWHILETEGEPRRQGHRRPGRGEAMQQAGWSSGPVARRRLWACGCHWKILSRMTASVLFWDKTFDCMKTDCQ